MENPTTKPDAEELYELYKLTHFTPFLTIFIWLMMLLSVLLIIPYFLYAIWHLWKYDVDGAYDTISSHCADPSKPGHRFLLATSCLVSASLAALYVEEYNSRDQIDELDRYLFWSDVVGILLLPLIGIFHSDGGGRIKRYEFFCLDLPIWISNFFHVLGTMVFVFSNSANNLIWVLLSTDVATNPNKPWLMALSVATMVFAGTFMLLQLLIKGVLKRFKCCKRKLIWQKIFFSQVQRQIVPFKQEIALHAIFHDIPEKQPGDQPFLDFNFDKNSLSYGIIPAENVEKHFIFHCCKREQSEYFANWSSLNPAADQTNEESVLIKLDGSRKFDKSYVDLSSRWAIDKGWRLASFCCEAITVILIIISAVVETASRNPNVKVTWSCLFLAQC